jgi:hypothetical protein
MIHIESKQRVRPDLVAVLTPASAALDAPPWSEHDTPAEAAEAYREWLRDQWQAHGPARQELLRLAASYKRSHVLVMVYENTTQHAQLTIIREAISGILKKGLV